MDDSIINAYLSLHSTGATMDLAFYVGITSQNEDFRELLYENIWEQDVVLIPVYVQQFPVGKNWPGKTDEVFTNIEMFFREAYAMIDPDNNWSRSLGVGFLNANNN